MVGAGTEGRGRKGLEIVGRKGRREMGKEREVVEGGEAGKGDGRLDL